MTFCEQCGAQLPDGATFCEACGASQACGAKQPTPKAAQPAKSQADKAEAERLYNTTLEPGLSDKQKCEILKKVIALDPSNPQYHDDLASNYLFRRMYPQAIEQHTAAINLGASGKLLRRVLGSRSGAYETLGNYQAAYDDCQAALDRCRDVLTQENIDYLNGSMAKLKQKLASAP